MLQVDQHRLAPRGRSRRAQGPMLRQRYDVNVRAMPRAVRAMFRNSISQCVLRMGAGPGDDEPSRAACRPKQCDRIKRPSWLEQQVNIGQRHRTGRQANGGVEQPCASHARANLCWLTQKRIAQLLAHRERPDAEIGGQVLRRPLDDLHMGMDEQHARSIRMLCQELSNGMRHGKHRSSEKQKPRPQEKRTAASFAHHEQPCKNEGSDALSRDP